MEVYAAPEHIKKPDLGSRDINAYMDACQQYEDEVAQWARENSSPHPLNGEVIHKPFADGSAVYVIAKLGGKVSLIHIETGDAWSDPSFERTATVAELKILVEQRKKRDKAFGR